MQVGVRGGSHRRPRNTRALLAVAGAATLVVTTGAGWTAMSLLHDGGCTSKVRLSVAAAPDIATVVADAAKDWSATISGTCATVDVSAVAPAGVAAAVAGQHHVNVVGLGDADGTARIPQVWVPDSSLWPLRLRAAAPGFQPAGVRSIASSPVVLAVPEPAAKQIGWPTAQVTWASLLDNMRKGTQAKAGIVDPTTDATGLSGLLSFARAAAGTGSQAQEATVTALRALASGRATVRDGLLARFPDSSDPSVIAAALNAAPLTEQSVIHYNNAVKAAVPLAAVYPTPAATAMDFPFIVMPGLDPVAAEAAARFGGTLLTSGFRDALARNGLRGPDGVAGTGFAAPTGAPATATLATAGAAASAAIDQVLDAWLPMTQAGRILAVLDVSGSMLTKVPTAGNLTREQVTVRAATGGLALFDDSWALGLWIFSTQLDGDRDYRELLPITPLSATRARAGAVLAGIQPKKGGQTGLYDTLLAAYRVVQDDWDPGRLNAVVIMTDGENQDASGIALPALLAQLRKLKDPKRPVDVVAIGIGPDIDAGSLQQVIGVTGGGLFRATDPATIAGIFLRALAIHTRSK
jgi:hypothetical protein